MSESGEGLTSASGGLPAWVRRVVPLGVGAVCVAGWLGLVGSLFAGISLDEDNGLIVTAALLGVTVAAALTSLLSTSRARIVACVAAGSYAAVFAYLRFGFDRMMPDLVLYLITAVFYLSPLVAGIAAIVAARRSAA